MDTRVVVVGLIPGQLRLRHRAWHDSDTRVIQGIEFWYGYDVDGPPVAVIVNRYAEPAVLPPEDAATGEVASAFSAIRRLRSCRSGEFDVQHAPFAPPHDPDDAAPIERDRDLALARSIGGEPWWPAQLRVGDDDVDGWFFNDHGGTVMVADRYPNRFSVMVHGIDIRDLRFGSFTVDPVKDEWPMASAQ